MVWVLWFGEESPGLLRMSAYGYPTRQAVKEGCGKAYCRELLV
jgi:hypothetical protein